MTDLELFVPVNRWNHDPRVPCALVMDVSYSMSGAPIAALSDGYRTFVEAVQKDPLARKRAEITVITFGSNAQVLIPFQEASELTPAAFVPSGTTDMAGGINLALNQLEARKNDYKAEHIEYFRPWLFLLTDGAPNPDGFQEAVRRLNIAETEKRVTVFGVGVGDEVQWDALSLISTKRPPLKLNGLAFSEMFLWISASLSAVSSSTYFGPEDKDISDQTEQIPLTPPGWGAVS